MKKYIISTAVMLTAVASVYAQQGVNARPTSIPVTGAPMMMPPTITTGDAATDTKIKVLQAEMEAKIKAIRDEYQAKIKALVGDKKVNAGNDMRSRGSSTLRMEGRKEGREGIRGSSTMMRRDDMMNGSGTSEGRPKMMERGEGQVPGGRQVKGESAEGGSEEVAPTQTGVRGFFGRLFGR